MTEKTDLQMGLRCSFHVNIRVKGEIVEITYLRRVHSIFLED